jgi:hypothetical protein
MLSRSFKLGVPVFVCAILTGGPAAAVLSAQAPAAKAPAATALPEAKTIIDRHIEAIGGRAALKARQSIKATGTLNVAANGMTATMEMYAARPNKRLVKMTFVGIGEIMEGFDGTNAWSMDPMTGPRLATGDELVQKALDADFDSDLDFAAKYTAVKTLEKTTFDGRECFKVSMTRKDGVEDIDFYDVATGLKAGSINTRKNQMGAIQMTSTLKDYKKFGPILQPSVVQQTAMGTEMTTTITAVEFDKVDPSVFDLPAQIKALIKQ